MKNNLSNLNNQIKSLSKENFELSEKVNIKKLQHKTKEKTEKKDFEVHKRLKEYAIILQENTNLKLDETKKKGIIIV